MSKIKLEKTFRAKWMKALRSGRYKQGQHSLLSDNRYCCLGVACKVVRIASTEISGKGMPEGIAIGVRNVDKLPGILTKPNSAFVNRLVTLNDSKGKDFKEIADYIENYTIAV